MVGRAPPYNVVFCHAEPKAKHRGDELIRVCNEMNQVVILNGAQRSEESLFSRSNRRSFAASLRDKLRMTIRDA
jgi:hypothetical protein